MEQRKVKFKEWDCILETGFYGNGRLALSLIDEHNGEPVATCTVNLPDEPIMNDHVFIKEYSENKGMIDALTKSGIIEVEAQEELHIIDLSGYGDHVWMVKYLSTPNKEIPLPPEENTLGVDPFIHNFAEGPWKIHHNSMDNELWVISKSDVIIKIPYHIENVVEVKQLAEVIVQIPDLVSCAETMYDAFSRNAPKNATGIMARLILERIGAIKKE